MHNDKAPHIPEMKLTTLFLCSQKEAFSLEKSQEVEHFVISVHQAKTPRECSFNR